MNYRILGLLLLAVMPHEKQVLTTVSPAPRLSFIVHSGNPQKGRTMLCDIGAMNKKYPDHKDWFITLTCGKTKDDPGIILELNDLAFAGGGQVEVTVEDIR